MKVLVTGAMGGIGRYVVRRLLEAGHTPRTTDITAQKRENDWEHIPGDITDLALIRRLMQGMDAVIHLAAIPYDQPGQDALLLETNLKGTWNVLLACAEVGVGRMVNFSSINALGQAEPFHDGLYLPLDDEVPHRTARSYYLSKHIGEELCTAFSIRTGMSVVSLRPSAVWSSPPIHFAWWRFLPEDQRIQIGKNDFFSYVDVRDVAEAALLGLTAEVKGHEAFLLTADDNSHDLTSQELVDRYLNHLPWHNTTAQAYFAGQPYRSLVDCSHAKRVLGWQPKYSKRDPDASY
ncbi:MAG TPA: NAD(P)-dependent oxidoreductase [Anaerolinea sp.]|nr:NAD(P)-dependent oxidoreductase [Anaerolinea sp.]